MVTDGQPGASVPSQDSPGSEEDVSHRSSVKPVMHSKMDLKSSYPPLTLAALFPEALGGDLKPLVGTRTQNFRLINHCGEVKAGASNNLFIHSQELKERKT